MDKHHWNVLVFPGGMENGLEIYRSLKGCKEVTLFSASSNVANQAFYVYKNNHICSDVRSDYWVEELNNIVRECDIDIIYPANSLVIDALHSHKGEIVCPVLLPSDHVLEITRSKRKTIEQLHEVIPCPRLYAAKDEIRKLPVFAKPDNGYGAQGARVISNKEELQQIDFNSYVVQELLPGKEYTIDCFSDSNGKLLFASGRERTRVRMATSMHAEPLPDALETYFYECAEKILKRIRMTGAWFFQMKEKADATLALLEIDVRIAGTMCYNRCKGVNFPLLSLYTYYGLPVSVSTNKINISLDRCLKNSYIIDYDYDTVYVDLDDTLVLRDKVNTQLISFLFQCLNNNKEIILLSKHLGDGNAYLNKYHIKDIFSSIVWMDESDDKYKYMKNDRAIYIDDSFSQRKEVADKLKIPTFDASMIECLIDERI